MPALCDPVDGSLPGSSVHGIFQARVLEWVAISFSRESSRPRDRARVSRIGGRRFTIWATREARPGIKSRSIPVSYIGRHILYHWATREALEQGFEPRKSVFKASWKKKKISWSQLIFPVMKKWEPAPFWDRHWGPLGHGIFLTKRSQWFLQPVCSDSNTGKIVSGFMDPLAAEIVLWVQPSVPWSQ